jgi:M3 family oligoendopeptidase
MTSQHTFPNYNLSELPYTRVDLQQIQEHCAALVQRCSTATEASQWIDIIREWNTLRIEFSTAMYIAEVRFTQDVTDEFYKAEKQFYDEHSPELTEWNNAVAQCIVQSPFRGEIDKVFGTLYAQRLANSLIVFDPSIKDLLVQESELSMQYNSITASATIMVRGQEYNLSTIATLLTSPDAELRKEAVQAQYAFFETHSGTIDALYDTMVQLRTKKAQTLGYPSYTEFRYVEMGRVDYDASMVEVFRNQVYSVVVPLAAALRKAQAQRIGVPAIKLQDEKMQFTDGNPVAQGNHDWIVERAQTMYRELSSETGEFFDFMVERNLLDLESRNNKSTGGYCTSFPQYGMPFIFANFNQTTHDIEVLTHEAGHAFQAFRSRTQPVLEYHWPTSEACEIHSMGMEFLTWPWMEQFFGEQINKFRFYHLQSAILFLPYACAVDEFQHWVYANPTATPAMRNAQWTVMETKYMPWRDCSDVPYAALGTQWQMQRHIIESPFYYIDYALAQTCALQYWQWSQRDATKAFESYLRLCDIGGSKPFLEIVAAGQLKSPFTQGSLTDVMTTANSWLHATFPAYCGVTEA